MTTGKSRAERVEAESSLVTSGRMPDLPSWESFAAGDRQRLVKAILHAARRQVTTSSLAQPPRR